MTETRALIKTTLLYDPPSGWQFGFPKPFAYYEGETLSETLRRDGYPKYLLAQGMAEHCRFLGGEMDEPTRKHLGFPEQK